MHGIRILVAENHAELRSSMVEVLQCQDGISCVDEAPDGLTALAMLKDSEYDIMVTEIVMPMMDGFTLLEEMRRHDLPRVPQVIVATALARDDFVMRAVALGVRFYLVKPFDVHYLINHVQRLADEAFPPLRLEQAPPMPATRKLDERLSSLFLTMGIPAHIKGYQFLREAVRMVMENPELINRITKELYPGIAHRFGTTASKVERAIRHAIEVAWNRGRVEALDEAFGKNVCSLEDKPTNGEFIALVADRLSVERSA